jgi:hypothetical protein
VDAEAERLVERPSRRQVPHRQVHEQHAHGVSRGRVGGAPVSGRGPTHLRDYVRTGIRTPSPADEPVVRGGPG